MSLGMKLVTLYSQVLLEVPAYPVTLAKQKILFAYDEILSAANVLWPDTKRNGTFLTMAPEARGTVSVSGTIVSGTSTFFTAAMVGLQFRISPSYSIANISAVNVGAQQLTLDISPGDVAAGSTYQVYQPWVILAPDMLRLLPGIKNIQANLYVSQKSRAFLNLIDPQRSISGQPYYVALIGLNPIVVGSVQANSALLWELYPYPSSVQTITFDYVARPPVLTDDSYFPPFMRESVFQDYALWQAYSWWANQKDCPSASASLAAAQNYQGKYQDGRQKLIMEAREILPLLEDSDEGSTNRFESDGWQFDHDSGGPFSPSG